MVSARVAIACALVFGCKHHEDCHGELTESEVSELRDAVHRGKDPCNAQEVPKIVLGRDSTVNGRVETSLATSLANDRANYKKVYTGLPFVGVADVTVDDDAPDAAGAIREIARAGYETIYLHAGVVNLHFDYAIRADEPVLHADEPVLHVEPSGAGWSLRLDHGAPVMAASRSEIASVATALCGSTNVRTLSLQPTSSMETMKVLADLFEAAPVAHANVELVTKP